MTESYIFSNITAKEFLERYMEVLGEEQEYIETDNEVEDKDVIFYDLYDVIFYDLYEGCSVMEVQGDEYEYSKEVICELAQNDKMVYTYLNEDFLEGTILVCEKGKITREFVECYSVPRLNSNIGELLDYEKDVKKISSWIDVGLYIEYMFKKAQ